MSQDIIIKQAGFPSTFNVDGIRTSTLSSKKETWDFVSSEGDFELLKMTVGKNGIFYASDYNAQAFAEIDVTGPSLDIITEPVQPDKNGDNNPVLITEGNEIRLFGNVKKLKVNIPNNETIDLARGQNINYETLYITETGKYKADDEGYSGYSKVRINIEQEATPKDGSDLYNNPFPDLPVSVGAYGGKFDYHGTYVEGSNWKLEIENPTEQHAPIYYVGYYNENAYTLHIFALSKEYFKVKEHWWMTNNNVITQDYHDVLSPGNAKTTKSGNLFYGVDIGMSRPANPQLGIAVSFTPYGKFNSFTITTAGDIDLFMKDLAEIVLYGNIF